MPAGYNYDAKLRIASAGLSPASTAASLAAPHLRSFLDLRIKDGVARRMIDKWLKAGVLE